MSPLPSVRLLGCIVPVLLAGAAAAPTAASASPPTTASGAGSSHRSPWGAAATSLVSRNSAGVQAQGASQEAAISTTGRYVAFTSSAGNLGGPDSVGDDVFVVLEQRVAVGEQWFGYLGYASRTDLPAAPDPSLPDAVWMRPGSVRVFEHPAVDPLVDSPPERGVHRDRWP